MPDDDIATSPAAIAMIARIAEWQRGHEKMCDEARADIKRGLDLVNTRISGLRTSFEAAVREMRDNLRNDRQVEIENLDKKWAERCSDLEKAMVVTKQELKESTSGWRKLAWWAITGICGIQLLIIGWGVVFFIGQFGKGVSL